VGRLVDERDKPLAIIVAPPGYGKSTLVAEWARTDDRPFLWASPISGWSELARLIRSARRRHSSYVLVLESADELEPDRLSEIVLAALNELPVDSTIAVVSRSEAQLPLDRLRAHRMLAEVRMGDLALSVAEGEALLRREGLELPTQDAQALVLRTEGWAAALQLAALGLRNGPLEIASFNGRQYPMFEYIREEVLAHLPPRLRRFATHTSVLEELCGPGCDAVLEEHGTALRLAEVAALSPLMTPLDPDHHRYRWHPLVREALRSVLHRSEPEQEPALHRRASVWYARDGDDRRAVDYAAAAGDPVRAGELWYSSLLIAPVARSSISCRS
jgi:LuxR family maltose regulon positive regulatory protein